MTCRIVLQLKVAIYLFNVNTFCHFLGLSACVPTSLDPGSVQIIISSHDAAYQEGDIHIRNCSEDTGGKFQSESMIGSFPGYVFDSQISKLAELESTPVLCVFVDVS